MNKATVGTIVLVSVASFLLFSLLVTVVGEFVSVADVVVGGEPSEPVLKALYRPLKTIYDYMRSLLSNNLVIAVLLAVSIVLLALELRWRNI